MKSQILLLAMACCSCLHLHSQERSPFRAGYLRLGINSLGETLKNDASPKANIFAGRYGAGTGYVFEFGHIYYFKKREVKNLINYGLDWTILSLTYNKMDGWEEYARASGAQNADIDGTKIAGALSSRIGPTVSFNAIEKLIIDLRLQISPTVRFFDFAYFEDELSSDGRYFSFINYEQSSVDEEFDSEAVKNRLAFGVSTGVGITVRRKAIGLSLDYLSGKVNSHYEVMISSIVPK